MIIFENVKIQNFLSYGNNETVINLKRSEPTLISGINYDASSNGELDSNGAGKSSILMAISVALYDKPIGIDGAKKNDLINNINAKNMLVSVELTSNKKKYKISRYRKNKAMGGDGVKIEENEKDITPDSIGNADKFIAEHIMQIPFEIFGKIVAYAAGTDSFLKMPLAEQRGIIEELFSYTELTNKATILKERIKNNKKDLEYAKDSNQNIKEEHTRHLNQLSETKKDYAEWGENIKEQISDIEKNIEALGEIDFGGELDSLKELAAVKKELEDIGRDIASNKNNIRLLEEETSKANSFESDKADTLEQKKKESKKYSLSGNALKEQEESIKSLENKRTTLLENNRNRKVTKQELAEIDETLVGLSSEKKELEDSKCPYCLQDYEAARSKLKDVNSKIDTLAYSKADKLKTIGEIDSTIESLETEIKNIEDTLGFSSLIEIERYTTKKAQLKNEIKSIEDSSNPYTDRGDEVEKLTKNINTLEKSKTSKEKELKTLKDACLFSTEEELFRTKNKTSGMVDKLEYLKEQTNPYEKVLDSLSKYKPKKDKDDEIDALIDDIKHQEFLLKLLTKKDSFIRKALMDKYLPFLNERLKNYLNLMGLPHKAKFTSDLSTEISQFGKEISYGNLSSGQKARINIALSLAFRDVLQSKHNFINLFILDECLDVGLSNVGVKKTLKVITDVATNNKLSMFVISHRDEIKNSFKDRVEIELRNGFSSVI